MMLHRDIVAGDVIVVLPWRRPKRLNRLKVKCTIYAPVATQKSARPGRTHTIAWFLQLKGEPPQSGSGAKASVAMTLPARDLVRHREVTPDDLTPGPIIGIVAGFFVLVCVVTFTVAYVMRRRRERREKTVGNDRIALEDNPA